MAGPVTWLVGGVSKRPAPTVDIPTIEKYLNRFTGEGNAIAREQIARFCYVRWLDASTKAKAGAAAYFAIANRYAAVYALSQGQAKVDDVWSAFLDAEGMQPVTVPTHQGDVYIPGVTGAQEQPATFVPRGLEDLHNVPGQPAVASSGPSPTLMIGIGIVVAGALLYYVTKGKG